MRAKMRPAGLWIGRPRGGARHRMNSHRRWRSMCATYKPTETVSLSERWDWLCANAATDKQVDRGGGHHSCIAVAKPQRNDRLFMLIGGGPTALPLVGLLPAWRAMCRVRLHPPRRTRGRLKVQVDCIRGWCTPPVRYRRNTEAGRILLPA